MQSHMTENAKRGRSVSSVSNASTSTGQAQACRECRRRKGKCDGKLPVCSVCTRYNRHCLYDKHSRSALTRKHLTEVEERLERAESLLRKFFTQDELSQMMLYGADISLEAGGSNRMPTIPDNAPLESPATLKSLEEPLGQIIQPSVSPGGSQHQADVQDVQNDSVLPETVPEDDFEWDERDPAWDVSDRQKQALLGTGADADVPRITDGMATLGVNENTGFLGSVSGAALLRMISTGTSENSGTGRQAFSDQGPDSLEETLGLQATNYSSGPLLRSQPLLTRAIVDGLVDGFFKHYHPTFPILDEATFREAYSGLHERPKGTWHILANLVAALGSFVSSTCSDETHITLFNSAKAHLSIESLEAGSLGLVQCMALAANYLQKRNRPNSGYNYGGVALRLAISMGLHKEFPAWKATPLRKEMRRRVWWSLCVLDVGATVTYGRPLNWPQVGVSTAFPLNISGKDLTSQSTTAPSEINEATPYTYVRTQSSYHLHTMPIYNRLISDPLPSASELISLDNELIESWLKNLPVYYTDDDLPLPTEYLLGHSIGRWRFRLQRIIMYRSFLLRWAANGFEALDDVSTTSSQNQTQSNADKVATKRCFKAAEELISILFHFWSTATHTRLAAWYVLYFLLQGALIPISCLRKNPVHPDALNWRAQVLTALNIINAMQELNPSATKTRDIINRLCGESLMGQHVAHTTSQPDTAYSSLNTFPFSTPESQGSGVDTWMTEIDTAINGYDTYLDRLTQGDNDPSFMYSSAGPGSNGLLPGWDEMGSGMQDWDLGVMLS